MSSLNAATGALGWAESTIRHDSAAAKLFCAYHHLRDLPEVMSPEEVEGEKLQEYILTTVNYWHGFILCGTVFYCTLSKTILGIV